MIHEYRHGSGVTLFRVYKHHADEVGTLEAWSAKLWQLFNQNPFKEYWAGFVIRACNLAAPETPQELIDYDKNTPGFQVADGLDPWGKEVWISFYPPGYNPALPNQNTEIPSAVREKRMNAVDHELGHQHDQYTLFERGNFMAVGTQISKDINRLISDLLPGQGHNTAEDYAECYRCLMGSDAVRGTFSDGKQWSNDTLRGLMRGSWYVQQVLKNKMYNNLSAYHGYIQWSVPVLWWQEWQRLNTNTWQMQKYTNNGWINT